MAINIQEYWAGIRKQRESLPPGDELYLVAIDSKDHSGHKPGVVCAVNRETAARCLFERTHQLANAAQIEAFHAEIDARTKKLAEDDVKRKQQFALPKELQDLVAVAVAAVHQQPQSGATPPPPETTPKNRGGK